MLDECDALTDPGSPGRQTIQNRIQQLALAGYLENKYDAGSYGFVSDSREKHDENAE